MTKKLDLAGERYGRLTVVGIAPVTGAKTKWICQCDCGNEKIVSTTHLRSGETKSCGCLQKELNRQRGTNLTGQTFGELTVVKSQIDPGTNATMWLCRCSCGNEKVVRGYALLQGTYTSCGCRRAGKRDKGLRKHITKDSVEGTRRSALTAKLHVNNSSGVKGVHFSSQRGKWIAYIGFQGKQINLGYYKQFEDRQAASSLF